MHWNFPISLLNKRWEADNEIQMPSRPSMSPANFPVGHFSFFEQNSSDGLMVRSKRSYSNGIITCRGSLFFFTHFSPYIQGSDSVFQHSCSWFFKYQWDAKGPVQIHPLESWEQIHSMTLFLRMRTSVDQDSLQSSAFNLFSPTVRWFSILVILPPPRGQWAMSGVHFGCHLGWECYWHCVCGQQGCCPISYNARDSPSQLGIICLQMSTVLRLRKPEFRPWFLWAAVFLSPVSPAWCTEVDKTESCQAQWPTSVILALWEAEAEGSLEAFWAAWAR